MADRVRGLAVGKVALSKPTRSRSHFNRAGLQLARQALVRTRGPDPEQAAYPTVPSLPARATPTAGISLAAGPLAKRVARGLGRRVQATSVAGTRREPLNRCNIYVAFPQHICNDALQGAAHVKADG